MGHDATLLGRGDHPSSVALWPYGGSRGLQGVPSGLYKRKVGGVEMVATPFGKRRGLCMGKENQLVTLLFVHMRIC